MLVGRSITETREPASCYTTYVISTAHHECISDSNCDTYMTCCQNLRADYSVCVPHKDHVLPEEKSHQSLSSGQKMYHKDIGHVFHLPQPSPIPIPILEKATLEIKSWENWYYLNIARYLLKQKFLWVKELRCIKHCTGMSFCKVHKMYGEENPNPLLSSFELVFIENERFFLA